LKPIPAFLTAWALAGLGAVIGSVLRNALGKPGLFAGAFLGGILGSRCRSCRAHEAAVAPPEDRRGAVIGGIAGFAVEAPIAVTNLHTPATPVLVCGLAGVGLLLGTGVARGWRRTS